MGIDFFIICDANGNIEEITNIKNLPSVNDESYFIGKNIYQFIHPKDITDVLKKHLYLKEGDDRKTKMFYRFLFKNKKFIIKSYAHKFYDKIYIHNFQIF